MTVSELIYELHQYDNDLRVVISISDTPFDIKVCDLEIANKNEVVISLEPRKYRNKTTQLL